MCLTEDEALTLIWTDRDMNIIDFSAEHAEAFKQLNLAWITEHWTVETISKR